MATTKSPKTAYGQPIKATKPTGASTIAPSYDQWARVIKTGESNHGN